MSCVYTFIGQCGVQIAEEFWTAAEAEGLHKFDNGMYRVTNKSSIARSVMVDTDPCTLRYHDKHFIWRSLNPDNVIKGTESCLGNWASGYFSENSELFSLTMQRIRREAEYASPYLDGVILVHSLGGGTGCGFGSRLSLHIADEIYPKNCLSLVVAPFSPCSDSPLQHYNTLLGLSSLLTNSDGILTFHNSLLLDELYPSSSKKELTPVNFKDINQTLVKRFGGLVWPFKGNKIVSSFSCSNFITQMTPFPKCKLVELKSFDSMDHFIEKNGKHQLQQPGTGLSGLIIHRNKTPHVNNWDSLCIKLIRSYRYCLWNPKPLILWTSNVGVKKIAPVTMAINRTESIKLFSKSITIAQQMLHSKAYLHWYLNSGLELADFHECIEIVISCFESYKELASVF